MPLGKKGGHPLKYEKKCGEQTLRMRIGNIFFKKRIFLM